MLDAIILSVMERTDRPRNTRKIFTKTSWEKKIKELSLQLWITPVGRALFDWVS